MDEDQTGIPVELFLVLGLLAGTSLLNGIHCCSVFSIPLKLDRKRVIEKILTKLRRSP